MGSLQDTRSTEVSSPLGDDVLLLRRMTASEELGRPFEFELQLLSEDHDIELGEVLGEHLSVRLDLPNDRQRYFDGLVTSFAHVGVSRSHAVYHATLRPWPWLLAHAANCRIFQDKTVPDIVKEVFRDHGFSDFEERLSETYRTWEYCVQYRETDFDFVSRLLEREGIYYFFEHDKAKHTLVLADSYSAHAPADGYGSVPYRPPDDAIVDEREIVHDWRVEKRVQSSTYVSSDFDFEKPRSKLEVKATIERQDQAPELEVYDYPGAYSEKGAGESLSKVRIEELQARYERAFGCTNARGLAAGRLFELEDHPRGDQNREYLIVAAVNEVEANGFESGGGGTKAVLSCRFEALDSREAFRAERTTPRPVVRGPQTAVVTGKSGEEIWTDEYGRVKVKFHWDRAGKGDETSSCWVRVAQFWAGKKFGGLCIPRIGQEVIVEFLEGDPDRPIVTGAVYNGDHMPPFALPGDATQSGIRTRSSKDGAEKSGNEIRFENQTPGCRFTLSLPRAG